MNRPTPWAQIEEDERYQYLSPQERSEMFGNWTKTAADYGNLTGALLNENTRNTFSAFVQSKNSELTAAAAPPPEKPFFRLGDVGSALAGIPEDLYYGVPVAMRRLSEGLNRPDQYSEETKQAFAAERARMGQEQKEQQERELRGETSAVGDALRQASDSAAFSIANMAVAIPAAAATTAAVSAAFPPAAPVTAPLTLAASAGAAMLTSAPVAYRIAGNQFLDDAFAELAKKKGTPLTEEETKQAYDELLPIAQNTALWEAGPEAVGNAVTLGVGKFVFGFGKDAAVGLASKAIGKAGQTTSKEYAVNAAAMALAKTGVKAPTAEMIEATAAKALADAGKSGIRRAVEKGAAVLGDTAVETTTEAITQTQQGYDQARMQQYAQTGSTEGAVNEYEGLAGFGKAYKEVFGPTVATLGLFGATAGAVKAASSVLPGNNQQKKEQVISDIVAGASAMTNNLNQTGSPETAKVMGDVAAKQAQRILSDQQNQEDTDDETTREILDDMEAKAAAEKPPATATTTTDPAAPVEDRIKAAMDELAEARKKFDAGSITSEQLGAAAVKLNELRTEKRSVARGEGDNVLQKYVDKTKVNSNDILDLLSEYSGVDAQTLADVPNPEAAVAWLQRNNIGVPGQPWRGRTLTPFGDQGAGTPLFDQAPKEPAAPAVVSATPPVANTVTPPAPTAPPQFSPATLSGQTDDEFNESERVVRGAIERLPDDDPRKAVAQAALVNIETERARRTPAPAPASQVPAPRTLDQFTEDELDEESTILERQAENEADPVRIEEINTQIQAVAAERQRRTAPPVTPAPAAPPVAVTTPPPVAPAPAAPAPSVSGVTNTQAPGDTFTLTNEPAPPVPKQQQPQALKPVVPDSGDQGQLPLGSGTNRDVTITPPKPAEGAPAPGSLGAYRQELADEARKARRLSPTRNIDQVTEELKTKPWLPARYRSEVMRRKYARELLDEARTTRSTELGVGTKTIVEGSQTEASIYDDSLSSGQVPSAKTIFNRLSKEAKVGKKTGNVQQDAEREAKLVPIRQQARDIETEANRLVAANLGIPNPESVVFAPDFTGKNTLPQRSVTKGKTTKLENIFVNDADITARQLDRGMEITIPKDQRNSVAEGITYDRKTGKVTAAVSGETVVSSPDQLQRVKKKRTKELSSSFTIPEESKARQEKLITIVQEFDNKTQSTYRSITRQVEAANIKLPAEFGPRVKAIALQIAGEALGGGKQITASTALKQSYRKVWERMKVRPELMEMSLDMGVDPNDDTTWIDIAETTDDTADTGRTTGGKKGEKMIVRNPRSDISRLVGRMTNVQAQNILSATDQKLDFGEALSSAERQAFEAAREYTLLRDRVQSEGKLDKVPAKEREELTYADLQEIGGVETQLPGTELPPGAFASAESRVTGELVEVTEAELAEAKDLIEEAVESFPAVNELIQMDIPGHTMYVRADNPRAIYVNPKGIAQVIQGVDRDTALAYIKKILNHETRHMALLRAMPVSELTAIGEGLTEAQLREAAESYHAKSEFATEEEREAALKAFMENPNVAAMEYITMLSERLQSGASIQDLGIDDMPLTVLERIVEALRAILNQLRTRMMLRRPGYEALAIGVERLEEGIRLLEEDLTLGDRIEAANSQGQSPDVVEVATSDVDIFPSANDTLGVDDNGFLRPATDAQGRRAYRVTINGVKVETTAKDPQIAARNAVFKMFDRAKQVFFEGQTYTSPKALIGAITASGRRVYKNDWGRKFAKPAVRKVPDRTPILPATKSEQAELPLFFASMADPAMRVRVGQVNAEGRPKGGFWDRLKLMVRGRYSETKKRTGGISGSGAATPLERDAMIAQQARIKGTIVKAESMVKNYHSARKKHKDFTDEQINAALGTTENPYTDAQVKELNKIKGAKAKDAKREEFRKANAATDRLIRQQALSQLPGFNPKFDGETEFHTGLAKAVEDMRIAIDEMSQALMDGDYIPAPLKPRVEQNLNVYLHRSYTIFDNPEWKRFMLAPQTDEHRRIQTAAARLFQKYAVAEIAQELRAEAEKAGAQMSQRDAIRLASRERERIATRAGNMLVDYLSIADDKANNFFVTGELPGQRKLDIIKVRGQIPKEVRELWGEIQKADDNFLKTMSKMAGYMSATDTARELVRIGLEQKYMWKEGVSEGERPAGYHLIYRKGDVSPTSVSPMDDVYAPAEVGEFMRSFRDHKTMYGWARQLAFMTAGTMAMKTIGNFPQGYVRNFFGNPFIMINDGYINPGHPAEMFKAAKKAFTLALTSSGLRNNEAIVKSVSELTSAGLIGEGVDSGLMREMTDTGLGDLTWDKLYEAGAYETAMKRAARQATGTTRNTFEFFARIYQGVDDFWKVFAYEMEKFYQRRTHKDWTEAQISKEAIDRVRNKVPTYSLSPELTRGIRNIPFIAPFITWTSETIRTSANNLAIAAEDIRVGKETKNPEMVKNGYRAIRGFAFALGAFPTLAMISKAMFGYDDEDEDAYREGLPEWEQNASLVFLGKAADGTGRHWNASFLDPYQSRMEGPIAFMRAMRNGDAFTDALVQGGMETLRPLLSEQLLFGAITSILRNRTAQGKPIYNEQDTAFNKTRDTMGHLALAAGPGTIVGAGRRLYLASQGTVLPTGQTYDVGNELLGMFGGQKVSSIDFRTTLNRAKNKYASSRAEATQLFSRTFSSQGTVDLEDIGPAYENAARAHRELQEEMMRAFDNAIRMGVPRKDAIQILRGGMGGAEVSKDDLRAILSGKPRRWTPSEVSLDSAKEGKIPDGRARLKALRDYMRSVKGAGDQ